MKCVIIVSAALLAAAEANADARFSDMNADVSYNIANAQDPTKNYSFQGDGFF